MKTYKLIIFIFVTMIVLLSCSKKTTESDNTTVRTPKFLPSSGTYEVGQYMSIQCATEDAEIRYTVDMTEPNLSSPIYTQSLLMPDFFINNSNTCRIKAKAFRSDLLPSATATANYIINYENTVAAPVISPDDGPLDYCPVYVSINNSKPGADIRYTTNGDEPDYTSTLYTGSFAVKTNTIVKAKAFMAGYNSSVVTSNDLQLNVRELGTYDLVTAYKVETWGDYAYVVRDGGLYIINISNPAEPVLTSVFNPIGDLYGIKLNGDYAYLVGDPGLWIVDISNPAIPNNLGHIDLPNISRDVDISGNYAYVASSAAGLRIVDISNPYNPVSVGYLTTSGTVLSVAINGIYAYLACGTNGIRIINISNPLAPVVVPFLTTIPAWGIAFGGNYCYIADGVSGLRVLNTSNLATPYQIASLNTFGTGSGVQVNGNYVYLTSASDGLRIIDVTNPAMPVTAGYCSTATSTNDVAVSGNIAYVADYDSGLKIIYNGLDDSKKKN